MKKTILLISIFLFICSLAFAQDKNVTVKSYNGMTLEKIETEGIKLKIEKKEKFFKNFDKNSVKTGILIDKYGLNHQILSYSKTDTLAIINKNIWRDIYGGIYRSYLDTNKMQNIGKIDGQLKLFKRKNIIPISILSFKYNKIKEFVIKGQLLKIENESLVSPTSEYESILETNEIFLATSWQTEIYNGSEAVFYLDENSVFSNISKSINKIEIDFDDGSGYMTISLNTEINVNYSSEGEKTIKIKIIYEDNTLHESAFTQTVKTLFYTPPQYTWQLVSNISYMGEYASGEAYIWSAGVLDKPVIVIEGFDPEDSYNEYELYDNINQGNLLEILRSYGYDIIVLNFDKSKDYIQKNAFLVKKLIDRVNSEKVGNEQLVLLGASMGGLISRYALTYMEHYSYSHNIRNFISFDSPQRGANIPLGDQYWLYFFATAGENDGAQANLNIINSRASKQMLVYHHTTYPYPHTYRTNLMNEISNLGDYPSNLRKVAFSNGNGSGNGIQLVDNSRLVYWKYRSFEVDIDGHTWAVPNIITRKIFDGYIDRAWPWGNDGLEVTVSGTLSYDNSPGGQRSTNQAIVDGISYEFTPTKNTYNPVHAFIPSISSLDINTTNLSYNIAGDPNILNLTPFHQIYYSNSNEEHIFISDTTKLNLLSEITNSDFPSFGAVVFPTTNNVGSVKADTPINGDFTIGNYGAFALNVKIQSSTAFDLDPSNSITYEPIIYRTLDPGSFTTINYAGVMGGSADYGPFTSTITIDDNNNNIHLTHNIVGTLLLPDFCYGETQGKSSSPEEQLFDGAFIGYFGYDKDSLRLDKNKSIKERLSFAYELLKQPKTESVDKICKMIIELYPESEMGISFYAMGLLWEASLSKEAPDFNEKDLTSYLKELTERKEKYKIYGYSQLILSLLDVGNNIEGLEKLFFDYEYDGLKELALFHQFIHYYIYKQDKETARNVSDQLDKMFVDSRYGYQAHLIFGDDGYTLEGLLELIKKKQSSLLAKQGESKTDILSEMPKEYKLYNNYPNPFNPTTTIKYSVPKVSNVKLKIYNAMGQLIKTLVNETKAPGFYNVEWNGTNESNSKVASGIYFYRFESDNFVANNKMILIK